MNIEYFEDESEIIDLILNSDGYRFQFQGEMTKSQIKALSNAVEARLIQEKAMSKGLIITNIYVVMTKKKQIQRKKVVGDVLNISDFYKDVDMTIVYMILDSDKIEDDIGVGITIPLMLDCETISGLFDINGNYIGSQKEINESYLI